MADLFGILEGIVADKDYRDENLNSADAVVSYAEACGETITREEAEKIMSVGKKWLHDQEHGNGEWSRMRHEAMNALVGLA